MIATLRLILQRNNQLMWQNGHVRGLIIILIDGLIIFRTGSITNALTGAVISITTPAIPINWFFLVLSPLLIVGNYSEQVVKTDYLLVSTTKLTLYLSSLVLQLVGLTSGLVLSWVLIAPTPFNFVFCLYLLITLNVLTLFYSMLSILIGSIYSLIIFIVALLVTTGSIYIPILAPLMFIHFSANQLGWYLSALLPIIGLILMLPTLLKKIDFN
ncbi:hypothetical protein C5Z25_03665 [Lactobacillus sp. CBA3605]|uniref:hypothetical protein n=1 Tax=Lactobacillus sp. CBA3605 TaxID=2099788 RepID=UPI000CFC2BE7|nr:hypothetical protein [Lactobacillus sp. CBA3605]AVK60905.1 hypothetical protein C5Z25_03665 [Lactobacillus sp. CBA3605]